MDEWINKMWSIHKLEYFSVIKRNETLTHATPWMNLEIVQLHERNQATYSFHFYEISRTGKSIETDSPLVVARGSGRGNGIWSDC